jgi:hypothetical protein
VISVERSRRSWEAHKEVWGKPHQQLRTDSSQAVPLKGILGAGMSGQPCWPIRVRHPFAWGVHQWNQDENRRAGSGSGLSERLSSV